jgi:SAM-dependent methyltransferase
VKPMGSIILENVKGKPDYKQIEVETDSGEKVTEITNRAYYCIYSMLKNYSFNEVLDIGSGKQKHARIFRAMGKKVITLDPVEEADIHEDYLNYKPVHQFEAIFCSHVLEHQRNVGVFLEKIFNDLEDGGILALSVPCVVNHQVSPGHCNWFNTGMLLYHLVLAGFDCREAQLLCYGYNLSVIVKKKENSLPIHSFALYFKDISQYFPKSINIDNHGIFGAVENVNWLINFPTYPHSGSGVSKNFLNQIRNELSSPSPDYKKAISLIDDYVNYIPDDSEGRYLKGVVLSHLGRYQESLEELNIAGSLGFNDFWIRFHRTTCFFRLREFEKAAKEANVALHLNPEHEGLRLFYEDIKKEL